MENGPVSSSESGETLDMITFLVFVLRFGSFQEMGNSPSDTDTSSSSPSDVQSSSTVSKEQQKSENENIKTDGKKDEKKRPCCVCKETRAARDLCYAEKAPNGFEECYKEIQAHKDCMLKE